MKVVLTYIKSLYRRLAYIWNERTFDLEVTPEVFMARLNICKACKNLEHNGQYICGICKCPLNDKCRYVTEECADKVNDYWADINNILLGRYK